MNTILVLGANGFSGRNFVNYVKKNTDDELIGFSTEQDSTQDVKYFQGSVVNYKDVNKLITVSRPDYIINLSGSFSNVYNKDFKVNVSGPKNILDSVLENNLIKTKILFIGSSAEYGKHVSASFCEGHPLEPISFYALTKVFQTKIVSYYRNVHNLKISIVRPSNLIGPKMSNKLFIGNFFDQATKVALNKLKYITIGSENAYRDFIDIRDAVKIYYELLIYKDDSDYNLGTGRLTQIRTIVDYTLKKLGISRKKIKLNKNIKKNDLDYHSININKLKKNFKCKSFYSIKESIEYIIAETMHG